MIQTSISADSSYRALCYTHCSTIVVPTVREMVSVHHQDVVAACFGTIVTQGEWTELFTPFGCEVPITPVDSCTAYQKQCGEAHVMLQILY